MNILIIGSKGFIGSHAYDHFLANNYVVFAADVMVDYTEKNYTQIDSTNADFHEIFTAQKYDVCLNCSGAASVPDSIVHPLRDFELNVHNVYKILDAIRKFQPNCKFINLSSAAVYGNPEKLPVHENDALNPVSPYGEHKKMAEKIVASFCTYFQISAISVRLFSVYGPRLKKQLFWDLSQKMQANNDEILIYGTGNESRDFLYVVDVVKIIDQLIQKINFHGQAINVASGTETTIKDVVALFAKTYNWNGIIKFSQQTRKGDPLNWRADISAIQSLNYIPTFTLQQGLQAYIEWLNEKI